ncbi:MAG: response regulator [Candidatus Omnitrophota bacterium]
MSKTRILIVDDEADYLSVMKDRLESWGYEVVLAKNGKEALSSVKNKSSDIVILDYFMPDIDGTAVLKEIRKSNKNLPVIMLTAHPDVDNIKGAQDLGVSAFISKFSAYSDVQHSLRSALDMAEKNINKTKDQA